MRIVLQSHWGITSGAFNFVTSDQYSLRGLNIESLKLNDLFDEEQFMSLLVPAGRLHF